MTTAAENLLNIARSIPHLTQEMRRDPMLTTEAVLAEARELGDEDDQETLDWLLTTRALRIVSRAELDANFQPARYTNRAARRARDRANRRK